MAGSTFDAQPGSAILYYREGWRTGYVEEVDGDEVKIQPIAAYKGAQPRSIWVPLSDIRKVV